MTPLLHIITNPLTNFHSLTAMTTPYEEPQNIEQEDDVIYQLQNRCISILAVLKFLPAYSPTQARNIEKVQAHLETGSNYTTEQWRGILHGHRPPSSFQMQYLLWRALGLEEQRNFEGAAKLAFLRDKMDEISFLEARSDDVRHVVNSILDDWPEP